MKTLRKPVAFLALLGLSILSHAGTIVPYLNDGDAVYAATSSQDNAPTPTVTLAKGMTLAAQFSPGAIDLTRSATGAVQVLEIGGTTSGSGLWIISNSIVFVTKSTAVSSYSTNLADLNGSDGTIAYSLGALTAGNNYSVWASFDNAHTNLLVSFNGTVTNPALTNTTSAWNWAGNGGIDFGGLIDVPARLGGLCNSSTAGVFYDSNAVALFDGTASLGQIFNEVVNTNPPTAGPEQLLWQGNVNSNWDINGAANWNNLTTSTPNSKYLETFTNGVQAIFDDTGSSTNVNVSTTVRPTSVTFSNNILAYALGGSGSISSNATVTVAGTGMVTISNANTYADGTALSAGTLALGNNNVLGTGTINLNGGLLTSSGGDRIVTNQVMLGAISQLSLGNGNFTFSGPIVSAIGNTDWYLTNGGTATIKGTLYQSGDGGFDIHASRLVIDGGMATNANDGIRLYTMGGVAEMDITNNGVYDVGSSAGGPNVRLGQTASDPGTAILRISSGLLLMGPSALTVAIGASASTTGMVYQTGGTVQWSGSKTPSGVVVGNAGGAYGEYDLDGGNLITPQITSSNIATGYFYANGGTITVANGLYLSSFISVVPFVIQSGGVVIDNGGLAATVSSPVSGSGPLTMIDTGTLILAGTNSYSGDTTISNGTLNVVLPSAISSVTVTPGATLMTTAGNSFSGTWNASLITLQGDGTLTFANVPGAQLTSPFLTATTINLTGSNTVSVSGVDWPVGTQRLLNYSSFTGGGSIGFAALPPGVFGYLTNNVTDGAIELVVTASVNTLYWYGNNGSGGSGGLWDIATTANWNPYASESTVQYQETSGVGDAVVFDDSTSPNLSVQVNTTVHPASTLVSNTTNSITGFAFYGPGKISGVGSLTKQLGGDLTLNLTNDYSGGTFLQQGSITLNTKDALPVAGILTLGSTGKSASLILNGFDQTLGGLLPGGGGSIVNNSATPVTLTFNVATGTATFYNNALGQSGNANANNFSVVKNGGGEQRLGVAYYSGTTVVNAGTLGFTALLDANLTNTITVNAGGTLDGVGVLGGPVTLNNGATLSPGNDGVGTLTITNNSLAMVSGATNWFEINNTNGQSDLVNLVGSANVSVTYGGALVVTNVGAVALTNGQTFQLFNVASGGVINDNFSTVTILPATGATGDFNPANGVLTINVSTIPTTPTNMTYSVGGGKISLSWPASYLGWSLQAQTNALNKGLGANWVTVPGSSLVTSTNFPLVPGNPAVFYRIFYQP